MSTRGARRWCPECHGQVYYHHTDDESGEDVYYCQGCGREVADSAAVIQRELPLPKEA